MKMENSKTITLQEFGPRGKTPWEFTIKCLTIVICGLEHSQHV